MPQSARNSATAEFAPSTNGSVAVTVHAPGTKVKVADDIDGTILSVMIGQCCAIDYKVVWWNGNERNEEWLQGHELTPVSDSKLAIGFHAHNHVRH